VVEHVLAAADMFSKVLDETPEADVAETARAFANKMREPEQSVYVKSERIADEVLDSPRCCNRAVTPCDPGV
jgi:chromatin segregation and condensation protein Rec8/ScpA/Scc1 (kleisin family)